MSHPATSDWPGHSIPAGERAVAVRIEGLSKRFRVFKSARDRIHSWLLSTGQSPRCQEVWALRDLSLSFQKGECIGIVGSNGSGKSTLLKILAGTLLPSSGRIQIEGRVFALLELATGFNPDLSGRENIAFAGQMLGLDPGYVEEKRAEIEEFSGLGESLRRPVKTYSSGMLVRLGFSMFAFIEPDVLIIDEALSVGDSAFQLKCIRRMEELIYNEHRTVIIVSHDVNALARFCDRVIWLDGGVVRRNGDPDDVIAAYIMANSTAEAVPSRSAPVELPEGGAALSPGEAAVFFRSDLAEIDRVWVEDESGAVLAAAPQGRGFSVCYRVRCHVTVDQGIAFGIRLVNKRGEVIISTNTHLERHSVPGMQGGQSAILRWPIPAGLLPGDYFISCGMSYEANLHDFIVRHLDAYRFPVHGVSLAGGVIGISAAPTVDIGP